MRLLESDEQHLTGKGYSYDVEVESNVLHLIIHNFPIPPVYSPNSVDLLIRIPPGYPNAKLDMFWTSPHVKLSNGSDPDRAGIFEQYVGRRWQRWSRHWPCAWRAGVDGLDTFIASIHNELQRGK